MAALLTGEMNVTRPIRSAITLPYIQISSYSEGGNTKHEYWLWVDPWNHVRSGDLTGTTMKGVKHGYYSRFQSDYNPLDYYYYYDHVHYTVAESTPRYPHIVQDSDAYPSLDPLFLMHGGRMTTAKYCGEESYISNFIALDLLGSTGSKASRDTAPRGNRWGSDTREIEGTFCSNTVQITTVHWAKLARKLRPTYANHTYIHPSHIRPPILGTHRECIYGTLHRHIEHRGSGYFNSRRSCTRSGVHHRGMVVALGKNPINMVWLWAARPGDPDSLILHDQGSPSAAIKEML